MSLVYLNGDLTPLSEARVSVLDRGFIFADGVYEVIPVFAGRPFRPGAHLARLRTSLAAISLPLDYAEAQWLALIDQLLEANQVRGDCYIYIQVTRGADERIHFYPEDVAPTVFIMCRPLPERDFSQGARAVLHEDTRWKHCHIKSTALLPNVLLKQYAREHGGAHEAILIRDGRLSEGAASNVFVVRDGAVATPPKDGRLLPGVTRDLVAELAQQAALPCREVPIAAAELARADEIWITSATMGVVPVVTLDDRPVGDGKPGPAWRAVNELYQALRRGGGQ